MPAFLYGTILQWKMNIRSKDILVFYYIVPLVFYLFMGGIFTSVMPDAHKTLIQTMVTFGVTMGGVLGAPYPLIEVFGGDIKKAYQVGGVPLWTVVLSNFISASLHLFLMSMVIFFTAPVIFDAAAPQSTGACLTGIILLIISSVSVGTVFGLFIRSASKAGVATQFVFLPSVMLSGIMFPVSMLPDALRYAGRILPATWGFKAACAGNINVTALLSMTFITLVLFAVSVWKLKRLTAV